MHIIQKEAQGQLETIAANYAASKDGDKTTVKTTTAT